MMKSFIERENEIFDILEEFNKINLKYVLVGGYAVSAYMHRFSVDVDVCIGKKDLEVFRDMIKSKRYSLVKRKKLEDTYGGEFECYIKKIKLPVTVDLMIGSIASRQTGISIGFDRIYANSIIKKIKGIEKEIDVRIPLKEVLIALKVHSARMTDIRHIVALCSGVDFSKIKEFVLVGKTKRLNENLSSILKAIKSDNFRDSFKGVFSIEKLPLGNIQNAVKLIEELKGKY